MKTRILLVAVTILFITGEAEAQIDAGDSLALVDLYNSTDGPNWKDHTNWLTKQPVSSWFGITTANNRVLTMYIYDNRLHGSLPSSIGNLTALTEMSLGYNQIYGSIPASIGNLTKLTFLSIFDCQLSGNLPVSIGNLVSLTEINLRINSLTGEIPESYKNLKKLKWVEFNDNQLRQNENTGVPLFSAGKTIGIKLENNRFTFNGLESVDNRAPFWVTYYSQADIPVGRHGKQLTVSAGGTLRNNTYYWYKIGSLTPKVIAGDSIFTPAESGNYYAKVKNSMAKKLTRIRFRMWLPCREVSRKLVCCQTLRRILSR